MHATPMSEADGEFHFVNRVQQDHSRRCGECSPAAMGPVTERNGMALFKFTRGPQDRRVVLSGVEIGSSARIHQQRSRHRAAPILFLNTPDVLFRCAPLASLGLFFRPGNPQAKVT